MIRPRLPLASHAVLLLLVATLALPAVTADAAAPCQLGDDFTSLATLLPSTAGACVGDLVPTTAGGSEQQTANGLFVWDQADGWASFTDGYHTWINGPTGLVERLNSERFPWEPDFASFYQTDQRFAVVLSATHPDAATHALLTLHAQWFEGPAAGALDHSPTQLQVVDSSNLDGLGALARRYPGRYWSLGMEPNGAAMSWPQAQPAAYAALLHDVATTLHSADPTARLVGPDVLNWTAPCVGCSGMQSGLDWTEAMRTAYVAAYGEQPPFDVWSIHTYPLDWQDLPTVDYGLMEQQIVQFRQYLDGIPGLGGKPIWDTELGVHWGYTAYRFADVNGQEAIVPDGTLRQDLVGDYLAQMLGWLSANGDTYGVTRWFVWSAYNPDHPGDHAGAISLLDGPDSGASLTDEGRIFVAASHRP